MVQTGMGLFPCHSLHQCLQLKMDLLPYENPRDRLNHPQLPILDFYIIALSKFVFCKAHQLTAGAKDNN